MDIDETYQNLWDENLSKIEKGDIQRDTHLNQLESDNRRGITLLCRPTKNILDHVDQFLNKCIEHEPNQYFYPLEDIHTTVLSLVTTGTEFKLDELHLEEYSRVIRDVLQDLSPFSIEYRGITVSAGAVMIKGYPTSDSLNQLRGALRKRFKESTLFHTMDARNVLHTAHITCGRFKQSLENPTSFVSCLKKYEDYSFGTSEVDCLEFVHNDWYMRKEVVEEIERFKL